MAVGLYLLSRLSPETAFWVTSGSMLVLGVGIGLSMQVLTIIVQNTAEYSRSRRRDVGGYLLPHAGQLVRHCGVRRHLLQRAVVPAARRRGPLARGESEGGHHARDAAPLSACRDPVHRRRPTRTRCTWCSCGGCRWPRLAFVVSLFLKEVPLRGAAKADTSDMGGGFGMPDTDSMQQLECSLSRLLRREGRDHIPALREHQERC